MQIFANKWILCLNNIRLLIQEYLVNRPVILPEITFILQANQELINVNLSFKVRELANETDPFEYDGDKDIIDDIEFVGIKPTLEPTTTLSPPEQFCELKKDCYKKCNWEREICEKKKNPYYQNIRSLYFTNACTQRI